jgi:hypothetical protein
VTGFVVAVCTNRLDDLRARWHHTIKLLAVGEFLVVLDMPPSPDAATIAQQIRAEGADVIMHGYTHGLSAARNAVLDARPGHRVLFIDDDVLLDSEAIDAVRAAFDGGAHVVGARLVPPAHQRVWPWFFGPGQMHLVGWHSPAGEMKTWGACMGVDATFAHHHGLRFDERLGRTGRRLESGDDTTFVTAMKARGARESLLSDVRVVHDVDGSRLSARYLSRRSYWQGRSEVRRGQPAAGFSKEWRRHRTGRGGTVLALGYLAAFGVGLAHEAIRPTRRPAAGAAPVTRSLGSRR